MKVTVMKSMIGELGTISNDWKRERKLGNNRRRGEHPEYSIVKVV